MNTNHTPIELVTKVAPRLRLAIGNAARHHYQNISDFDKKDGLMSVTYYYAGKGVKEAQVACIPAMKARQEAANRVMASATKVAALETDLLTTLTRAGAVNLILPDGERAEKAMTRMLAELKGEAAGPRTFTAKTGSVLPTAPMFEGGVGKARGEQAYWDGMGNELAPVLLKDTLQSTKADKHTLQNLKALILTDSLPRELPLPQATPVTAIELTALCKRLTALATQLTDAAAAFEARAMATDPPAPPQH